MEMQYASNGKGNLGVTLGAIGTGLGILGNGMGLLGLGGNNFYNADMAEKDNKIAILESENATNGKLTEVYERLATRTLELERQICANNANQAVINAQVGANIAVMQSQIGDLNSLTKTIIPIGNVCPQPMAQYNSWTSPASV